MMICRFCHLHIVWHEGQGWLWSSEESPFGIYGTERCASRSKERGGPEAGHALVNDVMVDGSTKPIWYASFGSGYRRTEWAYEQDGMSRRANRHPIFPDKVDGRGYVEVEAIDRGRARYLADFYLKRQYAGLYVDTSMWTEWLARDTYYSGGITEFLRDNGTLRLGVIDEDGLRWDA